MAAHPPDKPEDGNENGAEGSVQIAPTHRPSTQPPGPPLAESLPAFTPTPSNIGTSQTLESIPPQLPAEESSTAPTAAVNIPRSDSVIVGPDVLHPVALGEALQLVHFARRGDTLLISGITPHGRRLTFEQREDRKGWYVVAAGRRRRPTERELGLVVATITQEMEGGLAPERRAEVRFAYRLAAASDQPGLPVQGLEAYRDLLLDEAARYVEGELERLSVVAIDYQGFKRFAIRHGHRIGAAFVQALGERLHRLFRKQRRVRIFHKSGKAFRLVISNLKNEDIQTLIDQVTSDETKEWLVHRVWGDDPKTHPNEIHFHIGVASTYHTERSSDFRALAQLLSDDAHRASKLGQLKGHSSIAVAKSDYRTTVYFWNIASEDDLQDLAAEMDDGPAEVMAEMSDYLHELIPADLEGMAVAGDLNALVYCAIARDGFWQGTTAMRIAGDRLLSRFLGDQPSPEDENDYVGGFDLGDEFFGIALEGDELFFARGDINSAGATRVKAGLIAVQHAVGWRRGDGDGIVGHFIAALESSRAEGELELPERLREAAEKGYAENWAETQLHVNDVVDIGDFLFTKDGTLVEDEDLVDGAVLTLSTLGGRKSRRVRVQERRTAFTLRLLIEGEEYPAVFTQGPGGAQVKLRIRDTVASAAICVLRIRRDELVTLLDEIREDNNLGPEAPMDTIGFLRHITDILLEDQVKLPAKIEMALGAPYDERRFVRCYTMEDVREGYPGLFYEAVHHDLLESKPSELDREFCELIGHTMLSSARPIRPPED